MPSGLFPSIRCRSRVSPAFRHPTPMQRIGERGVLSWVKNSERNRGRGFCGLHLFAQNGAAARKHPLHTLPHRPNGPRSRYLLSASPQIFLHRQPGLHQTSRLALLSGWSFSYARPEQLVGFPTREFTTNLTKCADVRLWILLLSPANSCVLSFFKMAFLRRRYKCCLWGSSTISAHSPAPQ